MAIRTKFGLVQQGFGLKIYGYFFCYNPVQWQGMTVSEILCSPKGLVTSKIYQSLPFCTRPLNGYVANLVTNLGY